MGTASEKDFRGLFDDIDLNSNKLGSGVAERNRRLVGIIKGIEGLNFGRVGDAKIDLFGDAYEFLMNMYASSAGKSGGEFFTPQEVSELLARIVIGNRAGVNKVYDRRAAPVRCCSSSRRFWVRRACGGVSLAKRSTSPRTTSPASTCFCIRSISTSSTSPWATRCSSPSTGTTSPLTPSSRIRRTR